MDKCPICNSHSENLRLLASRGSEKVFLRKCASCRHEFIYPLPSDEWLSEEYSQYFEKRQSGLYRAKKSYFKNLFNQLSINFNGSSILEFGPGEGDAISALTELYSPKMVTVVERNPEANSMLKDLKCNHFNMFLEEYLDIDPDKQKFDYILLFDVLEHLKDPLHAIENLKKTKLNPRGEIIATFPVADSASRKILGRLWPQYKVEHLNYFTDGSIGEIARKTQMKISKNDILMKKLSLNYLLNVGKAFGPANFKKATAVINSITPQKIKKLDVSFGFGEKLVVFKLN
jgi:SAM-dependent methyltransferase